MFHITLNTEITPTQMMDSRSILHQQFTRQEGTHYKEALDKLTTGDIPITGNVCIHFHTSVKPTEIRTMHLNEIETAFLTRLKDIPSSIPRAFKHVER